MWEGLQRAGGACGGRGLSLGVQPRLAPGLSQVLSNVFASSSSWAGRYSFAVWGHVTDLWPMKCGIIDVRQFQAWSVTTSPMRWSSFVGAHAVRQSLALNIMAPWTEGS